jgi:hypothetical protein
MQVARTISHSFLKASLVLFLVGISVARSYIDEGTKARLAWADKNNSEDDAVQFTATGVTSRTLRVTIFPPSQVVDDASQARLLYGQDEKTFREELRQLGFDSVQVGQDNEPVVIPGEEIHSSGKIVVDPNEGEV